MTLPSHTFCVAPMMDWTDRHCRAFHRMLSGRARLYTEMVTTGAIIHGDRQRLLGFSSAEHPVALQLGGSEPDALARAAEIGVGFGYDEINLNCGCPSDRVQSGRFGACLMAEPDLVARLYAAMAAAVDVPVTVKCRIGIDEQDSEADFSRFVATVAAAGCRTFIVHARKAWLKGLSPKQNRDIPPLDYGRVHRLKAQHPELTIVLNGGITSLAEALPHLEFLDGAMLGRAAYERPYLLAQVDGWLLDVGVAPPARSEAMRRFRAYAAAQLADGVRLSAMTRHILGLYHGEPGGRLFRRVLSEEAVRPGAGLEVLDKALGVVEAQAGRQRDTLADAAE